MAPTLSETDPYPVCMSDIAQHPGGKRFDVKHACPDCPTPLAAIYQNPNPFCPWCYGTGLLTTEQLAQWQAAANARTM